MCVYKEIPGRRRAFFERDTIFPNIYTLLREIHRREMTSCLTTSAVATRTTTTFSATARRRVSSFRGRRREQSAAKAAARNGDEGSSFGDEFDQEEFHETDERKPSSSSSLGGGGGGVGGGEKKQQREEKKKTYAQITKRTPPRKDLGTHCLDEEDISCGAKLDLNDMTFVVSRVTKTYTLKYGKYVEDEYRRVEVESLERSLLNRQLGDVFKRS